MKATLLTAALMLIAGQSAQAALIDRGGGLIYDTELDVTWLQYANVNGLMTWQEASDWVGALDYFDSVRNITWSDWRLPEANPGNGSSFDFSTSYIGTSDSGYNLGAPGTLYAGTTANEMAHLFYTTLGELGYCDPGTSTSAVCDGPQAGFDGQVVSPFIGLQTGYYWSGTSHPVYDTYAAFFNFGYGSLGLTGKENGLYALAVRDGDVALAVIPVPAAAWLLVSGLALIAGVFRRH